MTKIVRKDKVYFVVNGNDHYGPFVSEKTARLWAIDVGLWKLVPLARKPE